ncbi:hypothetical protein HK097_011627 [Rhizophlyctis rosea]|uniref:Uncharacterized protein n=1 Tax=Rhizophlyctis rosea TaxID=64517 RepID=A0AAD5SHL9_9FUNG|nr:hypothetical protein HK097_011627 [Rhizophlyctis rosea]
MRAEQEDDSVRTLQEQAGQVPFDIQQYWADKGLPLGKEHFMERLRADGGDKITTLTRNYLHVSHTRFLDILDELKGLSLQQALLHMKWHQKPTAEKVNDAIREAIIQAKEEGFDLQKTYIAHAEVWRNKVVISQHMRNRYIRGRGRYGSINFVESALLEITLQERDKPFLQRVHDPLEWVREKLRAAQKPWVPSVEEVYEKERGARPIKAVYC